MRLDVLHALGRGLQIVDPVAAMYVKARYLVDAIRSGSRTHLVLAAAAEAASLAAGGHEPSKREQELFATARTLSENGKDPAGFALYQITYGVCEYLRGDWRAAVQRLDQVSASLAAMRRWNANAGLFAIYALVYLGDLREVKARDASPPGRRRAARRPVHVREPASQPPHRCVARFGRRRRARAGTCASRC